MSEHGPVEDGIGCLTAMIITVPFVVFERVRIDLDLGKQHFSVLQAKKSATIEKTLLEFPMPNLTIQSIL